MTLNQTFKYLARRFKTERPELDAILDRMAKRYTRAQLSLELLRLETICNLTPRPLTARQLELVRRTRQRSYRPLDRRWKRKDQIAV